METHRHVGAEGFPLRLGGRGGGDPAAPPAAAGTLLLLQVL